MGEPEEYLGQLKQCSVLKTKAPGMNVRKLGTAPVISRGFSSSPREARTALQVVGVNVDGILVHSTGRAEVNISYKEELTQETPGKKPLLLRQ